VDISVLVQDAATEEPMPGVGITVRATPRGQPDKAIICPATNEVATNKLFQAAAFELPQAGWWEMEVIVEGSRGSSRVRFEVEAAKALPRWMRMWPWIGWPIVVIVLFGIHQFLVRRKGPLAA
jgi:hypothetical protein